MRSSLSWDNIVYITLIAIVADISQQILGT